MTVKAVFFDVGETLVDETRYWGVWADAIGVPHLTFFSALGAVIEQGRHHRAVFEHFGTDVERARQSADASAFALRRSDFYPDAIPCLLALRKAGLVLGVAGNQPEGCEQALRDAGVEADILASSAAWGVEKPSPEFFARIVDAAALPPSEIAYVGDRFDNDVEPASRAGLIPIFIRRGPWGVIQDAQQRRRCEAAAIVSLEELPKILSRL